ncbi:MAG: DUF951 domain-containing protein [Armatimonadetes bacterium]|nr:DUF951 domain-containing protein [Armatimonadota bacterium]
MAFVVVNAGDTATLRKQHPCGGFDWAVYRVGADIGLRCTTCGRRVLLDRVEFERRVREVRRPAATSPQGDSCQNEGS